MISSNFHTHTCFCDGKNTPEELVRVAISKGFTALGFSGHSFTEPDADFAMTAEQAAAYRREIARLKQKYKGQLSVFCGVEQDILSREPTDGYDYVIGSVHYVEKNGVLRAVDLSAETANETVASFYGGDFDAYAEDYFALVSQVVERTNADIIGHFDLVSKYSEQNGTGQSARFLRAAEQAVKRLIPYGRPFEINTGAMAREVRTVPYPSPEILKIICREGGTVLFSSDCHDARDLDFGFETAVQIAREAGFAEYAVLTADGFQTRPFR